MIELTGNGVFLDEEFNVIPGSDIEAGRRKGMAWRILEKHNTSSDMEHLRIRFDAMVSPDNNYVNILQTARASGMERFPVPYVLSNCHNTLCAVGGTINEDDHRFGIENVKKFGGIFVPPYRAVLHQYMREMMAGGEKMILGSDSHTRYGALGTMGIGEGGGELVKQLVGRTYDISRPEIIAVRLRGRVRPGIGPMDVALTLVGACFENGFTKNRILEFVGDGIFPLSMEFRMGIDVMTTESAALSSVWCTDEKTQEYLEEHGRKEDFVLMRPEGGAYYDGMIDIDLSAVESMIALPFHPSRAVPVSEVKKNARYYINQITEAGQKIKGTFGKPFDLSSHLVDGRIRFDQALVSGCAGGLFENIAAVADILEGHTVPGDGISFGVNPASMPVMADLIAQGIAGKLAQAGVPLRPCICGPCFGVTDTPADNGLSVRHVTRNYPNREGSQPGGGQMASVCLMDARSIAATVRNGGFLTAATELSDVQWKQHHHNFDRTIYDTQVSDYRDRPQKNLKLSMGPNIADWPEMESLKENLLLKVAGSYTGSLTTDELIPSGEASSYRSNPEKISGYTLISKDPGYVGRAGQVKTEGYLTVLENVMSDLGCSAEDITVGSLIVSDKIGDGSSREQAASCQKVLGGFANLANEYSTKRYRSNCINWGILPLRTDEKLSVPTGSWVLVPQIGTRLGKGLEGPFPVYILDGEGRRTGEIVCETGALTEDERKILLAGSLINAYKENN